MSGSFRFRRFRPSFRYAGPIVAAAALVAVAIVIVYRAKPTPEALAPRGAEIDDYVGSATCAECHREIYDRQSNTRMAHTLQTSDDYLLNHPLPLPAIVVDEANRLRYHVDRRDGKLNLEVKRGQETANADMPYALGSGKFGVTFVRDLDSYQYEELRVTYYADSGGWDLTPGQRLARPVSARDALGRPIEKHGGQGCLNCHASLLVQSAGRIDAAHSQFNVACERCHGPGRGHVASTDTDELVEPRPPELIEALRLAQTFRDGGRPDSASDEVLASLASLDDERPIRDLYVCGECHGRHEIGRPYPDEQLAKFPSAALVASACYQRGAAKLLCTDCHDPHGDSPRDDHPYVAVCLKCHQDDPSCPVNPSDACIECHMPVRSPIKHTHFAHHRIAIYREYDAPHEGGKQLQPKN